jgi:ribonuclease HI
MAWARRGFNGSEVWVKVDARGVPRLDARGRADMVYRLKDAKVYHPAAHNLTAPPPAAPGVPDLVEGDPVPPAPAAPARHAAPETGAILIHTDGACTGNPGPMGIGVVYRDGKALEELSEYLGVGTNNIAELTAIQRALELVPPTERERPILVHSDSSYAIGLLQQGWRAKANQELVASLREQCRAFPRLRFVKVAGHAGVPDNERCDRLARDAIIQSSQRTEHRRS